MVAVPQVAAIHADGHVELKVETPLARLVERTVVEWTSGRRAKENALLVQAVDGCQRAWHEGRALDVDGSVDVCDDGRDSLDHVPSQPAHLLYQHIVIRERSAAEGSAVPYRGHAASKAGTAVHVGVRLGSTCNLGCRWLGRGEGVRNYLQPAL